MEYVELAPDGLFLYKWNAKKGEYVRKRPRKLTIATHLRSRCEIAEGTTLKNIFDAVDRYKFLKLIIGQYSWCRAIDEFHAQAAEPWREDPEDTDPVTSLEIYWHPEVHKYVEKKKHPGGTRERIVTVDFDVSAGFHGLGPAPKGKENDPAYRTDDGMIQYSVSCTAMWKLANLPVKLDKEFTVYEPFDTDKIKRGQPPEKLLEAKRDFTLLEVLDAIYWDISFYGGPGDNNAMLDDLRSKMDDIKSGSVAGIPLEQVAKQLGWEGFTPKEGEEKEGEKKMKIVLHPDVAKQLGVDTDSIPLDDKEIFRPEDEKKPEE